MVTPLVNRRVDDVLVKIEPSLHGSLSQVVDVMSLCLIHALVDNTPDKLNLRHLMTPVHFYEVIVHLSD